MRRLHEMFERSGPYDHLYILDEHGEPKHPADALEWARWMAYDERRILRQQRWQNARGQMLFVSTVFLGTDHSHFGLSPQPILWETMAWRDDDELTQRRYTSRASAIGGHNAVVLSLGGNVLD